jgi:GAF domain-containing protein
MIAKGADLKLTIDTLCHQVEELAPGLLCSVLEVDREGYLHPLSAPSLPRAYNDAIDGLMIGPKVGSCGSAAYLREPVVVTDIATDPRWHDYRHLALSFGLHACWSTPILDHSGRVVATFALYYQEARARSKQNRAS